MSKEKLTLADPVDAETRANLRRLQHARADVADKLLDVEQEKVRLLVTANRIGEEIARTFEKILLDRGLPLTTAVEIDPETGDLQVLQTQG